MSDIADVILTHAEDILKPLVPDSEINGSELVGRNPKRKDDGQPGSFSLNLSTGVWADFATDDQKGGDVFSFIAHCMGTSKQAARKWARQQVNGKQAAPVIEEPETQCVLPVPEGTPRPGNPDRINGWTAEWEYRDPDGQLLCLVRRYEKDGGKELRTWTYRDNGQWEVKRPPKPWPLYRLECFSDDDLPIYIAEGERAADAADDLLDGIGTTVLGGSNGVRDADLGPLEGRQVVIVPDADEPGRKYAQALIDRLQGKVKSLRVVDVWQLGWTDGKDLADIDSLPEDWDSVIVDATQWLKPDPVKDKVKRIQDAVAALAKTDSITYAVLRTKKAQELAVKTSELDSWVAEKRKAETADGDTAVITDIEEPEPWPEPVDGQALAEEIRKILHRHLILPEYGDVPCVLFPFHTHAFDTADFTPHLRFGAPAPRSGKTTASEIVLSFCRVPCSTIHATTATVFRMAEKYRPTILFDETDKFLLNNPEMEGLLNASFKAGAYIPRCEGDNYDIHMYSVFTPTILTGNGRLSDTIEDRSISVWMKRMTPAEKARIRKYRAKKYETVTSTMQQKLARWAQDNKARLQEVMPDMPPCLDARAEDIWEPLFQIAEVIGGEWPSLVWDAATVLSCEKKGMQNTGLDLLADIRSLLEHRKAETVTSEWLCNELGSMEGRPWSDYTRDHTISQLDLANLLHDYDIVPKQIRVNDDTLKTSTQLGENYKSYRVSWFFDAWERYLAPTDKGGQNEGRSHTKGTDCSSGGNGSAVDRQGSLSGENTDKGRMAQNGESGSPDDSLGVRSKDPENGRLGNSSEDLQAVPTGGGNTTTHPITQESIPLHYITDLSDAVEKLEVMTATGEVLGADLETRPQAGHEDTKGAALSPDTGQARLLQLYDGWSVLVIDLDRVDLEYLSDYLTRSPLVFHNSDFDQSFMLAAGIDVDARCTQLETMALTAKSRPSLAWACEQFLGITVDKEQQVSDWTGELTQEQITYAALDAVLVHALHQSLQEKLAAKKITGYRLVQDCIRPIACARSHGVLLDVDKHGELVDRWTAERDEAKARFLDIADGVDPESPKQLAEWLSGNLEKADLKTWPKTGKGQLSTNAETLKQNSHVSLVQPLLDYRHAAHRLKTWGHTYQRHLCSDGRIRPGFQLLGARTGRMSSQRPNVQNLPRDPEFRSCFIAPEGYLLVAADFSQIELRIAGLLSGDSVILDAYRSDIDLHTKIVHIFTGKPMDQITSGERKLGKSINFGLLYGGGAKTLQSYAKSTYGLDIELEEAEGYKNNFDQTYKKLRFWQHEKYSQHREHGAFMTVGGRLVTFRNRKDCYNDSRNYPVQGCAADLQMAAIARVHNRLVGPGVHLVNFVHDELVLEVEADRVEDVSSQLVQTMTDAFADLFKQFPAARDITHKLVEAGHGPDYGSTKE